MKLEMGYIYCMTINYGLCLICDVLMHCIFSMTVIDYLYSMILKSVFFMVEN